VGGTVAGRRGHVLVSECGLSVGLLFRAITVFVVVSVISGLVGGFTTMFVVPVMIAEDRGLVSAWRRFWPTLIGQWKQYAVYAVLSFVLQLVAGILASIVTVLAAVAIGIPLGVVGLVGVGLLSASQLAGWAVIGLAAAVFVLAVIAIGLVVAVPIQTYLRYYALLVLGDTETDFDLIPERRRTIRTDADADAEPV
jgi:ABC-type antimicrobial peptide transport system permease subunit